MLNSSLALLYKVTEDFLHKHAIHLQHRDFAQLQEQYHDFKTGSAITQLSKKQAYLYMAYRMPATFSALEKILKSPRIPTPQTHLDLGAGTGAASWAVLSHFPHVQHIHMVEHNKELSFLAQNLMQAAFPHIKPAITLESLATCTPDQNYDLVTLSYVMNELSPSKHMPLIQKMWAHCNQTLVVVEPGNPKGFQIIHSIREWARTQNISILAPCSHDGICPLYGKDWCHFTARFPRSTRLRQLKKGALGYEDEPFSYLILSNTHQTPVGARILYPPQKTPQGIKLTLCQPQSPKIELITKKSHLYKKSKNKDWGDCWEG